MESQSPFKKIKRKIRLSNSYSFRLIENKQKFLLSLTNSSNNIEISNDSNSQSKKYSSESIDKEIEEIEENKFYKTPNKIINQIINSPEKYKYQII